jgi:hypothetical protein
VKAGPDAKVAVKRIVDDLNDRRGLSLSSVDLVTRNEIRDVWEAIVQKAIDAAIRDAKDGGK